MMKSKFVFYVLASTFLCENGLAYTVLSEKTWITGNGSIRGYIETKPLQPAVKTFIGDVARAETVLVDQYGYQGMENDVYAEHYFYAYSGSGWDTPYTFRAKLCDSHNNCFNYEKVVIVKWKSYFGEEVISHLVTFGDEVGHYTLHSESVVKGVEFSESKKVAKLLLAPFPYDK